MFKMQSFTTKIFFLITPVVVISFLALTLIVSNISIERTKNDAYNLAEEMADKFKYEIMAELQDARVSTETLAAVLESLKNNNITDRNMINNIIKDVLADKEYIFAFSIVYEPDVMDETGRFASCWNKFAGNISVEPLLDVDTEDWYLIPKTMQQEYITDPYPLLIQGQEIMLVSFIFPLIHQGKFIGIIAADITLDKLHEIVSVENIWGYGEHASIISNSGLVVSHPGNGHNGKDISELWEHDVTEAKNAIKKGELYIHNCSDYHSVLTPIHFSDASGPWSVSVRFPMAEVLKTAENIRNYAITLSIISIYIIASILYLIAKTITRPILMLADTAKEIGDGNFDTEIPVIPGHDEISTLSTAFKVMTENLIVAKKQADDSNRAKSDFLSNMSHEMRTPLNAIIGMTSIGKTASSIEKKDYAFGKIEDASTHLLGVINDVLDMSKIEANKMELSQIDFDFEKMVRRVVNVINFKVDEKNQSLHVSIDKNIPRGLVGDDQRLSQVLTNLLSNAVKFTPADGTIRLISRSIGEKNGICTIQFEVADSGIGISPEQQEKLFHSFQQADSGISRKFGGTGLGLIISKQIIEMMGGEIHIESELGKGTTFIFTVQVSRSKTERNNLLNPGVKLENNRVMMVDDDPETLDYFREITGGMGIACDTAPCGEEAVLILEKKSHDIYFVDWKMPGMNGFELTKIIKAQCPTNTVVTMVSPNEWNVIADEARDAGVDHFLPKPIFPSELVDCINTCLGSGAEQSAEQSDEDESEVPEQFPGRRVLLAEDMEINREIVIALLEPMGLEIDSAENGKEALQLYRENPDRYDMIFMDMQMPEMDGLEATRRIRSLEAEKRSVSRTDKSVRKLPIIAMTANVFREDIEKCLKAGMDEHIGKPVDMVAVLEKLRKYLPADGKQTVF